VKLARRIFGGLTVALCACSGSTTQPNASGTIGIAVDVSALRNDGSLAHVTVTVLDAQGHPASGSVAFTASAGSLNGSGTTALSAALDTAGRATVTYACDVSMDPARCGPGSVAVNATWSGVTNGMRLTLQGLSSSTDAGSPDAGSPGGTDAGTGGSGSAGPPASVIATSTVPAILGLKGSGIQETGVTTFLVTDAAGRPVSNVAVTFAQRQPALVTLGRTTATTGSDGTVSVAVRSDCLPLAGDRPTPTLRGGFPLSPMDPETGAAGAFARDRAARALDGGHCANGTHQDTPAWLADLPVKRLSIFQMRGNESSGGGSGPGGNRPEEMR